MTMYTISSGKTVLAGELFLLKCYPLCLQGNLSPRRMGNRRHQKRIKLHPLLERLSSWLIQFIIIIIILFKFPLLLAAVYTVGN